MEANDLGECPGSEDTRPLEDGGIAQDLSPRCARANADEAGRDRGEVRCPEREDPRVDGEPSGGRRWRSEAHGHWQGGGGDEDRGRMVERRCSGKRKHVSQLWRIWTLC